MTPENPKKTKLSLNLSSPVKGRPVVFWDTGSTENIIIEVWPIGHSKTIEQKGNVRRYDFDIPEKFVAYTREKPNIRCVVDTGFNEEQSERFGVGGKIEWDGKITSTELRHAASLLREIITTYKKGRPRMDKIAEEAHQLGKEKKSWRTISKIINERHGLNTNKESIRKLVGARKSK